MSGKNCVSGAKDVAVGTNCQITAASGYTCTSPGECGSDGSFPAVGSCTANTCAVPTITEGVDSMSGKNCVSGAKDVAVGTNCQITAASGYTCTSPGECGSDGSF